jgi:hypothetical protein
VAQKLFKFSKNKVTPIVIVEPYVGDHSMQYRDYMNGKYDSALNYYFQVLKQQGVTDEMMGVWVPFPESNTPNWENKDTEPNDFSIVVNKYLSTLKAYFPKAHGSILLSAITYEPNDLDWENGDYISLTPYLANINKTLVDSLGIQGLPWMGSQSQNAIQIFRATEFLQPDIAISAAQELRTRDIWLNTGSFYTKYATNPEEQVFASLNERKGILDGIIDVAKYIKGYQLNEYRVRINLFSEDKSKTQEATDWSYFQNADSIDLLKDFLHKTEELEIPVSVSDKVN